MPSPEDLMAQRHVVFPAQANAPSTRPDTLNNSLQQIDTVLEGCEHVLAGIMAKIHGPRVAQDGKQLEAASPSGIFSLCMEINARAQRIHQALNELTNFLE